MHGCREPKYTEMFSKSFLTCFVIEKSFERIKTAMA